MLGMRRQVAEAIDDSKAAMDRAEGAVMLLLALAAAILVAQLLTLSLIGRGGRDA